MFDIFCTQKDTTGLVNVNKHQKCSAVLRLIAYGISVDALDEYLKIGKSTVLEFLKQFERDAIKCYTHEFLLHPNGEETITLFQEAEKFLHFEKCSAFLTAVNGDGKTAQYLTSVSTNERIGRQRFQ